MKERTKIIRVTIMLLVCMLITTLPGIAAGETGEETPAPTGLDVNESWVPGETVLILYYGNVTTGTVSDPAGFDHEISFTCADGICLAEYPLLENVIIGEYTVSAAGETATFCVGCCAINAWYVDGWINGTISESLRGEGPVSYACGDISGEVFPADDGSFAIPVDLLPGTYTMRLSCRAAETGLVFTVAKDAGDGAPAPRGVQGPDLSATDGGRGGEVTVRGIVYEDLVVTNPDRGLDAPIRGALVEIFVDDGDLAFNPASDIPVQSTTTATDGTYSFTVDNGSNYFIAVEAASLDTTRGRVPGAKQQDILAEQTYQVSFNPATGTHGFVLQFGGQDPLVTDDWSMGVYEHVAFLNAGAYAGESMDFGFSYDVIVNDIGTTAAQGSLHRFLTNAEHIAGFQESRFVMAVPPNTHDASGQWWKLDLTYRINSFDGPFGLNGTVFDNISLSPRDTNPGYVSYDKDLHRMVAVATPDAVPVGTGPDGREDTADDDLFIPVNKPEIELNPPTGNGLIELKSAGSYVSDIAGYSGGSVIESLAPDILIERCLIGMTANATPPEGGYATSKNSADEGINFNKNAANNTVRDSVIAFTKHTGTTLVDGAEGCLFENILVYRTARDPEGGHSAIEVGASTLQIDRSIIAHTDETDAIRISLPGTGRGSGPKISGSLIEMNAGFGISILQAPDTRVSSSVIRENGHAGIVVMNRQSTFNTFTKNAIYNNSYIGIDLGVTGGVDNVSVNDGVLRDNQPNRGMDYPVITAAVWNTNTGTLTIEGFVGLPGHDNADFALSEVEIYLVCNDTAGDNQVGNNWGKNKEIDAYYGEGWMYLGTTKADADGTFSAVLDVDGIIPGTGVILTGTATLHDGCTSEFGEVYYYGGLPGDFRGVSASISLSGTTIRMTITSESGTIPMASLYWLKPDGMTIDAMSGDDVRNASPGNEFTWNFTNLEEGVPQTVEMEFGLGTPAAWRISDLYNLGVDPL
ncbi:MAG TPA: right-handed parallel beta-helix repeat-containing protein [Methanoculleus sp.]|nr:right-handed parallel beta-helix repeat-containing protein [Methanoculleus sp.]